jgi:RNA binding exosome subunit
MSVDPSSTRFEEATKMVDSIKRTIDEKERAEMQARLDKMQAQQELAQKMHDDEVMLQKMQIEASKKNAQEQIHKESAGEKLQNSLSKWLFGNL